MLSDSDTSRWILLRPTSSAALGEVATPMPDVILGLYWSSLDTLR